MTKIEIKHMKRPDSIDYIKKKMDGKNLEENEIRTIIEELMENRLSQVELASFISAIYIRGLADSEVVALTRSIVDSGEKLELGKKCFRLF